MERFKYHFEPKKGWMNDPNGLVYFKGYYHAFFQHNPYDIKWGPMHWGHAISKDLIKWEELEIALFPDMEYEDNGGCFSGSAIVIDDVLYLFYTSVSNKYGQAQSIATSTDGIHFKKYENNPIITIPSELNTVDFRDPKVFKYNDSYKMILGSFANNHGVVLSYSSNDLYNWKYDGILYENLESNYPIECPDLFYLDNKWILMYSKIGCVTEQIVFLAGEFNGNKFIPTNEYHNEIGPEHYASQTFTDSNRRILIGWFYDWKYEESNVDSRGALTIPREMHYIDNNLYIYPVKEARPYLKALDLNNPNNQSNIKDIQIYASSNMVTVESKSRGSFSVNGPIYSVEILEDIKGTEVFINKGIKNFSILK